MVVHINAYCDWDESLTLSDHTVVDATSHVELVTFSVSGLTSHFTSSDETESSTSATRECGTRVLPYDFITSTVQTDYSSPLHYD